MHMCVVYKLIHIYKHMCVYMHKSPNNLFKVSIMPSVRKEDTSKCQVPKEIHTS